MPDDERTCELCGKNARVVLENGQEGVAYYRFWDVEEGWHSGPICLVCFSKLKGEQYANPVG